MTNNYRENPVLTETSQSNVSVRLRRQATNRPANPNRKTMTVDMSSTFEEVHEMNKKALRMLAKRA